MTTSPKPTKDEALREAAWIDRADLATLESDGWCVVHRNASDADADHNAQIALYTRPQPQATTPDDHPLMHSTPAKPQAPDMEASE